MPQNQSGPSPGQPGARSGLAAALATEERNRLIRHLSALYPYAPRTLRHLGAAMLSNPTSTSDALLLVAEAMDEAATGSHLAEAAERQTLGLATYLRDQAPRFADRPLP